MAFAVIAPLITVAALGVILCRKAVHSALCLAVVMIGLAGLYAALDAPFLFAVQIVVYTGAIMMLFLFVLMLVGVETAEPLTEVIAGHRLASILLAVLFGTVALIAVGQTVSGAVVGLEAANAGGNVEGLAALLFGKYVLAVEFTAALLMTAVLGAMILAHRERLTPRRTQREAAEQRMRAYAEEGRHPGNPPTPGVFARRNAVDAPALLPDGSPAEDSVAQALRRRGQVHRIAPADVEEPRTDVAKQSEAEPDGSVGDVLSDSADIEVSGPESGSAEGGDER